MSTIHSPTDAPMDSVGPPPVDSLADPSDPSDPINIPYTVPDTKFDPNLTVWGEPKGESYWRMVELVMAHQAREARLGLDQGWWPDPIEEAGWDPVEEAIQEQELAAWTAAQKDAELGNASSNSLPFVPYQNPHSSQPGTPASPTSPTFAKSELGEVPGRHLAPQPALDNCLPTVAQVEHQITKPSDTTNSNSIVQPLMKCTTPDVIHSPSTDAELQSREKAQGKQKDVSEPQSSSASLETTTANAKSELATELEPVCEPDPQCRPASASVQATTADALAQPAVDCSEVESGEMRPS